jgi:hypothetical protein
MYRLSDEDARAVDLLLDAHAGDGNGNGRGADGNGGNAFQAASSMTFTERLTRIERLLNVMGQMPATDPPANLVLRTMQAIEAGLQATTPTAARPGASPAARANRPQA